MLGVFQARDTENITHFQRFCDTYVKDQIYKTAAPQLVDFAFDARVAQVFPDMIRRSVPGYELVVPMTGLMAAREVKAGERIYDLGCSLGATSLALLTALGSTPCQIIAVDQSSAMLARAREHCADPRIRFVEDDVRNIDFEPARAVLSNWLLQFITPEDRLTLLARVAQALVPGGVLLLSEKIRYEEDGTQSFMDETHLAFKAANGYSDLEIRQKRAAIENVMIVDTESTHRERLAAAGFREVTVWFRCLNWVSFIART